MNDATMRAPSRLLAGLVIVMLVAAAAALLLPMLSSAKRSAMEQRMLIESRGSDQPAKMGPIGAGGAGLERDAVASGEAVKGLPTATIKSFAATIGLTPRLSVGTSEPESIYQADFTADLTARHPDPKGGDTQIELPLPPEIISLADLTFTVNGKPDDHVALSNGRLVWRGTLPAGDAVPIKVTYAAVGKGFYQLQTPPDTIVESYKVDLTTHGSDVRMLELSLQPTSVTHGGDRTQYVWDYKKLMFGRPIALDVLGIAPVDRLGNLATQGPISVLFFGVVLLLVAGAFRPERVSVWMVVFILGAFAAAYPLMYFAQEFVSLRGATIGAVAVVLALIAARAVTLLGWRLGLAGIVLPAAGAIIAALTAALVPRTTGIVITIESLAFFVVAMSLAPRIAALLPPKPMPMTQPTIPLTPVAT